MLAIMEIVNKNIVSHVKRNFIEQFGFGDLYRHLFQIINNYCYVSYHGYRE